MWVLDTDGDVFHGKKLWLRPGKKYLFGRTSGDEGGFSVTDKTVSRQHMTAEIEPVSAADFTNSDKRSQITITDVKGKVGTTVNGKLLKLASVVLDRIDNVVTLGRYKDNFRFTWVPVTLTYSFAAKELKANPYAALYDRLGPLDIRVSKEYERGKTTHVVAKKRNTAKGLQALIDGRNIVHDPSFVDALVSAASLDTSPLEEDFESNFPDPLRYLPPRGEEPTERGESAYAPDEGRQNMFEGYTFVFYERRQYDNLLAPIAGGGGKVALRQAMPDQSTVENFVTYVKGLAGEKGLGEFEDGSEGKGVVVVRYNPVKGPGAEWYAEFGRKVALHLDHRLIEQNEFLDAILGVDAGVLRRPLEIEYSGIVAPPPSAAVSFRAPESSVPVAPQSQAASVAAPSQDSEMPPPSPSPPRRGRGRRAPRRNIAFDDDDFQGPPPSMPESVPESMVVDPEPEPPVESQYSPGLFVSQDPDVEMTGESQRSSTQKRKRLTSPVFEEEEEEDLLDRLAPTNAALKKRRLERGESMPAPAPAPKREPRVEAPKKVKKEIDVVEITRQKNEEAEAAEKAEREELLVKMEGMDIVKMPCPAIIEELQITRKTPPMRTSRADESDRWDDKWNGRKDFKRFKRRGANGQQLHERVLVPMEEYKTKEFGIGDEYWGDGNQQKRKKKDKENEKGKGKDTQDLNDSAPVNESGNAARSQASTRTRQVPATTSQGTSQSTSRSNAKATSKPAPNSGPKPGDNFGHPDLLSDSEHEATPSRQLHHESIASSSDVEIVAPPPPKSTATTSRTSRSQRSGPSQESSARSTAGSNKRVAETPPPARQPAAKKQKPAVAAGAGKQLGLRGRGRVQNEDEDEDSEDDLKFKFKRGKR